MNNHVIVYVGDQTFIIPDSSSDEDDFWEPVKITLDVDQLKFTKGCTFTCTVCMGRKRVRYPLRCCGSELCRDCSVKWFTTESVCCPYCRKDLREIINE